MTWRCQVEDIIELIQCCGQGLDISDDPRDLIVGILDLATDLVAEEKDGPRDLHDGNQARCQAHWIHGDWACMSMSSRIPNFAMRLQRSFLLEQNRTGLVKGICCAADAQPRT